MQWSWWIFAFKNKLKIVSFKFSIQKYKTGAYINRTIIMKNQQTKCNKNMTLKTILFVILLCQCALTQLNDDSLNNLNVNKFPTFQEYAEQFDKKYPEVEFQRRRDIYNQRIVQLQNKRKDPGITYQVGVTKFTDWTLEQINAHKKILTDENSKKQFLKNPKRVAQTSGIPASLDWRNAGAVTSIKDQGDCGACWTFATTAYGQSRLIINKTHTIDLDLSEQYLLSCTSQCSCDGGYLEYVFEKAAGGIPLQSQYQYSPYAPVSPFICWSGKKVQIGYIPEKMYDLSDNELKQLLQKGPVAISISATNWEDYTGGVFKCKSFDKVNHAVLLIGYTPNEWIVKNQWGVKWGQKGFIRVSSNPLYNCKIGTSAFVMWEKFQLCTIFCVLIVLFFISS